MVNVFPGTALHVQITNDLHFFKGPYSLNSKRTKTHNNTGQTNKYSKEKDKNERSYPCFCHKMMLYYVRKAHTLVQGSASKFGIGPRTNFATRWRART